MQINKEWLDNQLQALQVDNVLEKVIDFKRQLKEIWCSKLSNPHWALEEFFTLAVAFNIAEELCGSSKSQPSIYLHERASGTSYVRPLLPCDVDEIRNKINEYYPKKLAFFKEFSRTKDITEPTSAMVWLLLAESVKRELYVNRETVCYEVTHELTQDNPPKTIVKTTEHIKSAGMSELITRELAKLIRFANCNIDSQLAEEGIFPESVYSISEAAKELALSENQFLIECCKNPSFGLYLKDKFKVQRGVTSGITEVVTHKNDEPSYVYPYSCHIRFPTGAIREELYKKNCIESFPDGFRFIPLQLSQAERLQGLSASIILNPGQKIELSDFVCIKSEIDAYKAGQFSNTFAKNEPAPSQALFNLPQLVNEYSETSTERNISVEKLCDLKDKKFTGVKKQSGQLNGKHYGDKRKLILKNAIAVVLCNPSVIGGKAIAQLVEKRMKDELLSFAKMIRLINKSIKFKKITDSANNNISEELHMLILSVVFELKEHFSSKSLDQCVELIAAELSTKVELLGISNIAEEAKKIFKQAVSMSS